jgi:hypothetical protein
MSLSPEEFLRSLTAEGLFTIVDTEYAAFVQRSSDNETPSKGLKDEYPELAEFAVRTLSHIPAYAHGSKETRQHFEAFGEIMLRTICTAAKIEALPKLDD